MTARFYQNNHFMAIVDDTAGRHYFHVLTEVNECGYVKNFIFKECTYDILLCFTHKFHKVVSRHHESLYDYDGWTTRQHVHVVAPLRTTANILHCV